MAGRKRKKNDYFEVEKPRSSRNATKNLKKEKANASKNVQESDRITRSVAARRNNIFVLINGQNCHIGATALKFCDVLDLCELAKVSKEARKAAKSALSLRRLEISVERIAWGKANRRSFDGLVWYISMKDQYGQILELELKEPVEDYFEINYNDQASKLILYMARNASLQHLDCKGLQYQYFCDISALFEGDENGKDLEEMISLNKLVVTSVDLSNCLQIFTPRHLEIVKAKRYTFLACGDISNSYAQPLDTAHPAVLTAESLVLRDTLLECCDKEMLKMRAERIILCAKRCSERFLWLRARNSPDSGNSQWSRNGIAAFIQQWLRGERNIRHVACGLPNDEAQAGCAGYAGKLTDLLRKLHVTPKSIEPLKCNRFLRSRLYYSDEDQINVNTNHRGSSVSGMIYKHAVALTVERQDGKHLAIVLRREHVAPHAEADQSSDECINSPDVDNEKRRKNPLRLSDFSLILEMFEL